MIERERKFLVDKTKLNRDDFDVHNVIEQGYLMFEDGKQLRVRLVNYKEAFLTYKSDINKTDRNEFEYQIPYLDGCELLKQCGNCKVYKVRMEAKFKGNLVCVDVYHDTVVCEVEYKTENLEPEFIPNFCTQDITGDKWFSNIQMALRRRDGIDSEESIIKLENLQIIKNNL